MVLILFSSTLAGAENSVCSLLEVIVAIVYLTAFYPQSLRSIKLYDAGASAVGECSRFHVQCSRLKAEDAELE